MANPLPLAPALIPTPIPPGCPWHELSQYGLPNVNWCEETLCAVINEPANAWSNLAYILVAAVLFWIARPSQSAAMKRFAPAVFTVGTLSFCYHATNVHITQVLDFLAMYIFCYLLLLINVQRLGLIKGSAMRVALLGSTLLSTALTAGLVRIGFPIQSLIAALTLAIVVTELLLYRRAQQSYSLRYFGLSLLALLAGTACSAVDATRRLCDPQNHFLQGHAAWHLLSALSLLLSYFHFRQFDKDLSC